MIFCLKNTILSKLFQKLFQDEWKNLTSVAKVLKSSRTFFLHLFFIVLQLFCCENENRGKTFPIRLTYSHDKDLIYMQIIDNFFVFVDDLKALRFDINVYAYYSIRRNLCFAKYIKSTFHIFFSAFREGFLFLFFLFWKKNVSFFSCCLLAYFTRRRKKDWARIKV